MYFKFISALLIVLTVVSPVSACLLKGKVIKITDGDTVTVLDVKKVQHKIRLAGIDTPERKQPFGNKAKRYLSSLVGGKTICVDWHKQDRYKRKVGKLLLNNRDINFEMVRSGLAWHYKKYQREQTTADQSLYSRAENNAKSSVTGLWSEPYPIPTWEWRKGSRPNKITKLEKQKAIAIKRLAKSSSSNLACGSKRFCTHMDSCTEARFYLTQCGLTRLDRDSDGIPCESICR